MGDRVGFGVVGAGAIGIRGALMHLCQKDVQDRVRLAAVCDPVPGRAAAAAAKYGVAAHYLTYEELLAVLPVDDPSPFRLDELACDGPWQVAQEGGQVPTPARGDFEHGKAVVWIVKRHPFDDAGQGVQGWGRLSHAVIIPQGENDGLPCPSGTFAAVPRDRGPSTERRTSWPP